ncbi:MAG: DUF4167 domain-containing protein, partial [Rhodospirillaceae bacterium]|nr:DUF4167 domain-containing protein [Rhodospirillaceae bacterium]
MRQGQNPRRSRNRNNNNGGHNRRSNLPNRNQTFDSNGPEVRIRGNAYQVYEKYLTLARDAYSSGDRVKSENYYQHAEHYHRIITAYNEAYAQSQQNEANGSRADGQDGAPRSGNGRDHDGGDAYLDDGRQPAGLSNGNGVSGDDANGSTIEVHSSRDPRDQDQPMEAFGRDPRQDDGAPEADMERQPALELGGSMDQPNDGEERPRRRRAPRPRRTPAANGASGDLP